jgi:hypothetical protein
MKPVDDATNKSKGWIYFWILGYPLAVAMFVALSHLNLF